ncbi:MAG: ribonuclease R, partial [Deltaproteobacteria bacterium]
MEDVYLPKEELTFALDGDRLAVRLVRRRGRVAGELVEILERRRSMVVGTFHRTRREAYVEPFDEGLPPRIPVRTDQGPTARSGQVVKVRMLRWPTPTEPAEGVVVEVLGDERSPKAELLSIAFARGFADVFPEAVLREAEALPETVRAEDFAGRRDLRDLPLVTIDGADAKDFDDAVYVEKVPGGGFRLVVAIADVAHYVRPGSHLDEEALRRATSVYLPGLVLPMLPEKLSNGICSLVPYEERLCMVAELTLDAAGKTVNTELYEGVMRSHARLTYEMVAAMMGEGEAEIPKYAKFWEEAHLEPAVALSRLLNERRQQRGSIDLDIPETYPVLGEDGRPVRIERRQRTWAHRLIEEFMLAANEAVAWFFEARGLPTIFRVHDVPDREKLMHFAALARVHGADLKIGKSGFSTRQINAFLRELEGKPEQHALNTLLLRSMQQAVYSAENIGHYGLAAENYLHFTSPIRRYPDLMVHRLLKAHWERAGRSPSAKARACLEARLDEVAVRSSERERAAMDAEREAHDYLACLYMQPRVGEHFDAVVTAVTDFGLFVEIVDHGVEGLVKAETLGGHWVFDDLRLELSLPEEGRTYRIGDTLRVVCAAVHVERRQIDFVPEAYAALEASGAGGR